MKTLTFLAGAAALALAAPGVANPGHGQGGHGHAQAQKSHGKSHATRGYASRDRGRQVVATRNGGWLYALDTGGTCPPGLAKKHNRCMPPGQAKRVYAVGQHYNRSYGYQWTYNRIPSELRSRYDFDRTDRYYYRNGYVYQVDPRTMLVERVVSALLR